MPDEFRQAIGIFDTCMRSRTFFYVVRMTCGHMLVGGISCICISTVSTVTVCKLLVELHTVSRNTRHGRPSSNVSSVSVGWACVLGRKGGFSYLIPGVLPASYDWVQPIHVAYPCQQTARTQRIHMATVEKNSLIKLGTDSKTGAPNGKKNSTGVRGTRR